MEDTLNCSFFPLLPKHSPEYFDQPASISLQLTEEQRTIYVRCYHLKKYLFLIGRLLLYNVVLVCYTTRCIFMHICINISLLSWASLPSLPRHHPIHLGHQRARGWVPPAIRWYHLEIQICKAWLNDSLAIVQC